MGKPQIGHHPADPSTIHLAIDRRTGCPEQTAIADDAKGSDMVRAYLCPQCFTDERMANAQRQVESAPRLDVRLDRLLERAVEEFETPEQRALLAAMAAGIRANMAAAA